MPSERHPVQGRAIRDLFDEVGQTRRGARVNADVNAADDTWDDADFRVEATESVFDSLPWRQDVLPGVPTELPLLDAMDQVGEEAAPHVPEEPESEPVQLVADSTRVATDVPSQAADELDFDAGEDLLEGEWALSDAETFPEDGDALADWHVNVDLPDFDPDARVEPWSLPAETNDLIQRRVRFKAAELASQLEVTSPVEVLRATDFATGLYSRWRHPQTHAALLRLAQAGLDLGTLKEMVALRREWENRSDWWVHRYYGRVVQAEGMRTAFTWRLAHDVCVARVDFPVESMIGEDWLEEWFSLGRGALGYLNFAEYIAVQVDSEAAIVLYDGLRLVPGDHLEERVAGDHHSDFHRAINRRD